MTLSEIRGGASVLCNMTLAVERDVKQQIDSHFSFQL